jgi:hypothetical protein
MKCGALFLVAHDRIFMPLQGAQRCCLGPDMARKSVVFDMFSPKSADMNEKCERIERAQTRFCSKSR